jgi:hypothetical protein
MYKYPVMAPLNKGMNLTAYSKLFLRIMYIIAPKKLAVSRRLSQR